jgi:murein L,D-transpeptidase YcbB/YkuD
MRGHRYDRLLAGTALALVLTAASPVLSAPDTPAAIEAGIPVPEPANVPPPTAADIGMPATKAPDAAPATTATAPSVAQPETASQIDPAVLKTLTGKDLVKAPIASNLSVADAAVAEKIRDLLATKADRYFGRKAERSGAEAFYRDRGFAPLWIDKGAPSARATAAIAYLRGVDADGLFPEDYPTPEFKPGDADALAEAELKYSNTVLSYARHAQSGRVAWSRVSADILYPIDYPDADVVLAGLAGPRTIAETLGSYNPPHAGYKALKAKLAEARRAAGQPEKEEEVVIVAEGPTLRPGTEDPRVPSLRKRLKAGGDESSLRYDDTLVAAVKEFQKGAGLAPDGLVGAGTLRKINGGERKVSRTNTIDLIIANMERWRWLPRDLGKAYVMLNIPDFTLKVMNNGAQAWTTRVVTGKPGRMATPMLTETMKFITVNPTWNVPPSIINNEYLPALQQDPDALDRIGLKMTQNPDGTIRIYQPPGAANALGRIRFNFPNKFLVYQHDTPDKNLFAHDKRAYSHGCMRVQNPDKYAEVLLGIANPKDGYTAERIQKMYGGGETNINLNTPIPVHITYQTAFVDDAGHLQIRDDVYGRDAALLANLKGDARKNADVPVERREVSEKPAVARLPQQDNSFMSFFQRQNNMRRQDPRFGGRSANNSDGFFRLFR